MTMTLKLSWEDLRATWVRSGAILGQPGVILGLSWEDLGATWVHLGGVLCHVGAIFGEFGSYLAQLGATQHLRNEEY